jgi:putative flippase GtrA
MQTTILRLMPHYLRARISPVQIAVMVEFIRFGAVGFAGFIVDTASVYATRGWLGLYGAGIVAYFISASFNWLLNRLITFRGKSTGSLHRQWAMFLVTNMAGFVLNRSTYALLVTVSAAAASQPVIATAAGSVAGMFINFSLSRRLVFR